MLRRGLELLLPEMCRSKVSQKFLEAHAAVGLALVVALEHSIFELFPAVGAHEALGVELLRHGGDDPASDHLPTDAALVLPPVRLVEARHLLEEGSPEHLGHVLLLERLVQVSETSRNSGPRVSDLDVPVGHPVVAVQTLDKIVQLLAGLVALGGDGAVVPDGLSFGWRRGWARLLRRRRWFRWLGVLPKAEPQVMVLGLELTVVSLDDH